MPKIRKKTSNRQDTHTREKVKKKISAAKKKAKKAAKKDVTWKSNKPEKDLGIPSKFPFKDQILQEAAELKAKREEEKKARREAQKAAHQAASLGLADPAMAALAQAAQATADDDIEGSLASDSDNEEMDEDAASSSSLKLHAKSLREVIDKSDVIVQVLDARDPNGTRSRKIEREAVQVHGKKLVLVLNKIDLVPRETVEAWLAYLRRSFPTLPFKSSTQAQRKNLSSGSTSNGAGQGASSSSPAPLLTLLKNYSRAGSLTIGVIGFPNVGKSSLINTLKRSRACGVAPTPGFTKDIQIVSLDGSLKILDCPGVVYEGGDAGPEQVLRNATKVENVQDPVASVEIILQKCKREHLMMLYNIPAFDGIKDFLIAVARVRGRLKKGGIPDLFGTARSILRDWNAGRIAYYTVPPAVPASSTGTGANGSSMLTSSADVGSAEIMTALAPEFNFDDIFAEADSGALADIKSSKEMGPGGAVKMNGSLASEGMETEGSAMDAKFIGEDEQEDENDAEDDDEDEAPLLVPTPSTSKKAPVGSSRKRSAATVEDEDEDMDSSFATTQGNDSVLSRAAPTKAQRRVTFDTTTPSAPSSSVSAQKKQMFADAPEEEPIALNKSIKQAAKKQKKSKQKMANRTNRMADDVADSLSSMLMGAGGAEQAQESTEAGGEAKPYDFAKFFGAP